MAPSGSALDHDHRATARLQRFANRYLVCERPIHFGRIEESDAAIYNGMEFKAPYCRKLIIEFRLTVKPDGWSVAALQAKNESLSQHLALLTDLGFKQSRNNGNCRDGDETSRLPTNRSPRSDRTQRQNKAT